MTLVGYISKAGKLGVYKKLSEAPDKFNKDKTRVHLATIDGKFDFWVDKDKLVAPPKSTKRYNSCSCSEDCCVSRCMCESHCNCKGGYIYDC
jgi:hypothetical protein